MKIQFIKVLVMVGLLLAIYAFSGFNRPVVEPEDFRSSPRMTKAWIMTLIMVVTGAVLSLWGNDIADIVDWDVPHGLYPTLGILLLLGGLLWMWILRDSTRRPNPALQPTVLALCTLHSVEQS